jgi:hypothetical protein
VSALGIYGGAVDLKPMMDMFDKQIQLRMGRCNVRRWIDVLLPLVDDDSDPLGVMDLVTSSTLSRSPRRGNVQVLPGRPTVVSRSSSSPDPSWSIALQR